MTAEWILLHQSLGHAGQFAMVGGTKRRVLQMTLLNLLPSFSRDPKCLCLVAEGPSKGLDELKRLAEVGELVPTIDRVFRLEDVPAALRYFGEQHHTGKIAVSVRSSSDEECVSQVSVE